MDTLVETTNQPKQETRWQALREKMDHNACHLRKHGAIVAKQASGRRVWVLRFIERESGRRVHRSIYIGGDDRPELLRRARRLLEQYREQHRQFQEATACARMAAAACGMLKRLAVGRRRVGRHVPEGRGTRGEPGWGKEMTISQTFLSTTLARTRRG